MVAVVDADALSSDGEHDGDDETQRAREAAESARKTGEALKRKHRAELEEQKKRFKAAEEAQRERTLAAEEHHRAAAAKQRERRERETSERLFADKGHAHEQAHPWGEKIQKKIKAKARGASGVLVCAYKGSTDPLFDTCSDRAELPLNDDDFTVCRILVPQLSGETNSNDVNNWKTNGQVVCPGCCLRKQRAERALWHDKRMGQRGAA